MRVARGSNTPRNGQRIEKETQIYLCPYSTSSSASFLQLLVPNVQGLGLASAPVSVYNSILLIPRSCCYQTIAISSSDFVVDGKGHIDRGERVNKAQERRYIMRRECAYHVD